MPRQPREPKKPAQQGPCDEHQRPEHTGQQQGYMPLQQPSSSAIHYTGNGYPVQMGYPAQYPHYPPQYPYQYHPQYPQHPQDPQHPQHQMRPQHQQQSNMPLVRPMPRTYAPAPNVGGANYIEPNMQMVSAVQRQYVDVRNGYAVLHGQAGAEVVGAIPMPLLRPMFQAEYETIWSSVADVLGKLEERKAGKQRAVEPADEPEEVWRFSSEDSLTGW